MEKNVIVKFLIALAVLKNVTRCNGRLSAAEVNHVNYMSRLEHWQDMWFHKVKTFGPYWTWKRRLSTSNVQFGPIDKLKTIPFMMGCGYGQKLNDFLRLMAHTIDECNSISPKFVADDCWSKLRRSVATGASVMSLLVGVFRLLHAFDKKVVASPFFEPMERIRLFLKIDGHNWPIMFYAHSLEIILITDCKPEHSVVNTEKLAAEYRNLNTIINLYDYYVSTLDSYTGYISEHLRRLGFQYDEDTEETFYTTPVLNE
ncbi:uncharacterized protein LOC126839950 isoform X2 [Adelges cooleyi]|uniref:uncharacterized protein LOC126839950 isoform X1 n=1 Tax=Adelges cooleyi TaxID=133065 RepID=UPI00217F62AE|nr:uncharacterized protein LOC126839950 isoform X1 [Adelges cooleyi]XP_050431378.1 uncharacterized protein LOC126839950 isoform X2 [Adelges cooleyi]